MTTTMKPPIEGDWLPPAALSRHLEAQLAAGAARIEARTVDLASGLKPIETTMVRVGPEVVEVYGKAVPATAWDLTVSSLPGITLRDYLDDQGTSIKSTIPLMPGIEMTVLEAEQGVGTVEADAHGNDGPDLCRAESADREAAGVEDRDVPAEHPQR